MQPVKKRHIYLVVDTPRKNHWLVWTRSVFVRFPVVVTEAGAYTSRDTDIEKADKAQTSTNQYASHIRTVNKGSHFTSEFLRWLYRQQYGSEQQYKLSHYKGNRRWSTINQPNGNRRRYQKNRKIKRKAEKSSALELAKTGSKLQQYGHPPQALHFAKSTCTTPDRQPSSESPEKRKSLQETSKTENTHR